MDKLQLHECIKFFDELTVWEEDITDEIQRENGQRIIIATYHYQGKSFKTKPLYYKNIEELKNVKDPERIIEFFGEPVFWLDNEKNEWPNGPGAKLEGLVLEEMAGDDGEFRKLLLKIANDQKNGFEQLITAEGRSVRYGINLENNNHWHDLIKLIKAVIASGGEAVDKGFFQRLVFRWDSGDYRTSLHPSFGDRALIHSLYNNIKSLKSINMSIDNQSIKELLTFKKHIILQGPPGTGKTYKAKEVAKLMTERRKLGSASEKVDTFFREFKSENLAAERAQDDELLRRFQDNFPKNELGRLTLERYAIGNGLNDSFCWWIERGLKPLGYYFPGSSRTYRIYWSKGDGGYWKFKKFADKDDQVAMEELAGALFAFVEAGEDRNKVEEEFGKALQYFSPSFLLKVLHSYYPDLYMPINSERSLRNALRVLGISSEGLGILQMNLKVQDFYESKVEAFKIDAANKKAATNIEFMRFLFGEFSLNGVIEIEGSTIVGKGQVKIIQFHPAYTYEDFVRGIVVKTDGKDTVQYVVENKVLADIAASAFANPTNDYVLIIDEINRANLPAVMGELIYALEYRYKPEEPEFTSVDSMYEYISNEEGEESGSKLKIPNNLYIIGTMNTADRSVGHIDYAIRRRFAFVEILPDEKVIADNIPNQQTKERAVSLFNSVAALFNEGNIAADFKAKDVQLGHSYFIANSDQELKLKLDYEIKPILREYLADGILKPEVTIDGNLRKTLSFIEAL